jgi:hypothetical protein
MRGNPWLKSFVRRRCRYLAQPSFRTSSKKSSLRLALHGAFRSAPLSARGRLRPPTRRQAAQPAHFGDFSSPLSGRLVRVLVNGRRSTHGRLVASGERRSGALPCFSISRSTLPMSQALYGLHHATKAVRLDRSRILKPDSEACGRHAPFRYRRPAASASAQTVARYDRASSSWSRPRRRSGPASARRQGLPHSRDIDEVIEPVSQLHLFVGFRRPC